MGRNINNSHLSKNYILSKVSQAKIFSVYFNIPIHIIEHCIDTGELICSPIRDDVHPTCGFRFDNRGKLKLRDFAGYFWGDCFDAVATILSCIEKKDINVNNKQDFYKILTHITITFKNIFYGDDVDETLIKSINNSIDFIKKQKNKIDLVIREWNEYDKEYWNKIGVNLQYLNINFVYPIDQYYINIKTNPNPKYYYDANDPCYAYYLGADKNGIKNIKLYFPKRDKLSTKFITNANHLEGIYNLNRNDYDYIIITKSSKDRLSLGCTLNSINSLYRQGSIKIGVINIPHETYKLRLIEIEWLRKKLSSGGLILSLMDNDRTGKLESIYLRNTFSIIPLLIPKDLGCKDFAELRASYNIETVSNIINETFNKITEYETRIYKSFGDFQKEENCPF